jgi:hypothetical protein
MDFHRPGLATAATGGPVSYVRGTICRRAWEYRDLSTGLVQTLQWTVSFRSKPDQLGVSGVRTDPGKAHHRVMEPVQAAKRLGGLDPMPIGSADVTAHCTIHRTAVAAQ